MRFVCDSCRAQYMISDDKVGAKGVKVRCKKCGFVILVRKGADSGAQSAAQQDDEPQTQIHDPRRTGESQAVNGNQGPSNPLFGGVDDDELGAAFDQALGGVGPKPSTNDLINSALGAPNDLDENDSTRVMDADAMRKLAESTQALQEKKKSEAAEEGQQEQHEWFVAIDEKQSGPFTVERIKELWDRGEIGPDSLTWRAGLSDWQPMSEIAELAGALAPRPKAPVMMAPVATGPSVVNVPVESAFNAGGVNKTVRGEMPVNMGASAQSAPEAGGWKPSAASALASLVKDEIDSLQKPASVVKADAAEALPVRGLLDLPSAEAAAGSMRASGMVQSLPSPQVDTGPVAPGAYAPGNNGYGAAPAYGAYRPGPTKSRQPIAVYAGIGAVLFLIVVGMVALFFRQPNVVYVQPAPQVPVAAAPVAAKPVAVAAAPTTAAPATGAPTTAPATGAVPPTAVAVAPPPNITAPTPSTFNRGTRTGKHGKGTPGSAADGSPDQVAVAAADKTGPGSIPDAAATDAQFDEAFGASKKVEKAAAKPKIATYVPPPVGGGAMPDRLEQGDIMGVVLQNKPAIVACVGEQKKREPGGGGKLVMHWTILPSGKTSGVQVAPQSSDLKSSYMASCITGLLKGMKFPQHKVQGEPIDFPFTF